MSDIAAPTTRSAETGPRMLAAYAGKGDNSFSAVRLLAAIAVIYTHAFTVVNGAHAAEPMRALTGLSLGTHAVHVFFALSGFMVAASWERAQGWQDFAVARILRLMPALIVANLAIVVLGGWLLTTAPAAEYWTLANVGGFLLRTIVLFSVGTHLTGVFTANPLPDFVNIPIWTIRFEIICYVSLALVMLAGTSRRLRRLSPLAPVLLVLLASGAFLSRPHDYDSFTFLDHLAQFLFAFYLGVGAWLLRTRIPVSGLVLLALLLATALAVRLGFFAALPLMMAFTAYASFCLGALPLGWLRRATDGTDLSYGSYIMGFFIQQWLIQALPHAAPAVNAALATVIALAAAWCTWTLVEKPAMGLRRHFAAAR